MFNSSHPIVDNCGTINPLIWLIISVNDADSCHSFVSSLEVELPDGIHQIIFEAKGEKGGGLAIDDIVVEPCGDSRWHSYKYYIKSY